MALLAMTTRFTVAATLLSVVAALPARPRALRQAVAGCCSWGTTGTCGDLCGDDGSTYCHLSASNCVADCDGTLFIPDAAAIDNCDGGGGGGGGGGFVSSQSSDWGSDYVPYTAPGGQLTSSGVGSSVDRLREFTNALVTGISADASVLAVHSSGGAAGGVVSEGQGYGLLIAGATLAAMPSSSAADRDAALTMFHGMFKGWRRMCELSAGDASCQADEGYLCADGAAPCLPHWKFDDDLTAAIATGAAPDGDEDAMAGMVLGVLAVENDGEDRPAWYPEVADWAYDTCHQFLLSNTVQSISSDRRIVKLGTCWGGWGNAGQNPSYHAPGAYRLCRDHMVRMDAAYGVSSTEGDQLASVWNSVVSTTYEALKSGQCAATGLVSNWAKVTDDGDSLTTTTGFSGSGTPSTEFGAEASRTVWRVALDYILFPAESATDAGSFLSLVANQVASKESGGTFGDLDLDSSCLVSSVHADWQRNAFMFGPTFASLVCPAEGLSSGRQQAVLDSAAAMVARSAITDYYSGSWVAIATITLNGDFAVAAGLLTGEPPTAESSTSAQQSTTSTAETPVVDTTTEAPVAETTTQTLAVDTTTTTTGGGGGGGSSGCCTWDLAQGCQGGAWCSTSESQCTGACGGSWLEGSNEDSEPTPSPTLSPNPLPTPSPSPWPTAGPSTSAPQSTATTDTPAVDTTTTTVGGGSGGCCTWDLAQQDCQGGAWCSASESRCGWCGGTWI